MKDMSGIKWGAAPTFGIFGAGRNDEIPDMPEEAEFTPSSFMAQEPEQPADLDTQEAPGGAEEV